MAEEIKRETGSEATLVAGKGGVFDVIAEGRTVFSKFQIGRFPQAGEIAEKLKAL